MLPILQTGLKHTLKKQKDLLSEQQPKPLDYLIQFNPNQKDSNDKKIYEPFFNVLNNIIEEDTGAKVLFDLPSGNKTSDFAIDKTKSSKELDIYNQIKDEMENKANKNTLWKNTVVKSDRNKLINSYTDAVYGLTQHVRNNMPDNLSNKAREEISNISSSYLSGLQKSIRENTNLQYQDYKDAKWGLGKSTVDASADFLAGIRAKKLSIQAGLNTDFEEQGDADKNLTEWIDSINEYSNTLSEASGLNALPLKDIIEDENTTKGDVLSAVFVKALQSLPSSIPSLAATGAAFFPGTAPLRIGIGLTGYAGSNLMETGSSAREYQEELQALKSNAKLYRERIEDDEDVQSFKNEFNVSFGDFSKPIDEYSDDEIRQMADAYANQYARFASVVELASLGVAGKLGNLSRGYSGWVNQGGAIKSSLSALTKFGIASGGMAIDEGFEEGIQNTISEYFKTKNLPNREFNIDNVIEGAIVGGATGLMFGGAGYVASARSRMNVGEMSPLMQENIAQIQKDTKLETGEIVKLGNEIIVKGGYDNAIIFGMWASPRYHIQNIAKSWGVSEDEVEARKDALFRSKDINRTDGAAKRIFRKNPEIAEIFPETQNQGYEYSWGEIEKKEIVGKPKTKQEIEQIAIKADLTDIERKAMQDQFDVDPPMPDNDFFDEGSIDAIGNEYNNFGDDQSIIRYEIEQLKLDKQILKEETSPIGESERESKIKEIDKKIKDYASELKKSSNVIKKETQKKIEKSVEKKQQQKKKKASNIVKNAKKINKSTGNKKTSTQAPKDTDVDIDIDKIDSEKEKFEASDEFKNAPTLDLGFISSPKEEIVQSQSKKPPIDKEEVKTSLKNANGKAYNEVRLSKEEDIKLFSKRKNTLPNVYAKSKRIRTKIDKVYNDLWMATKEKYELDDTKFEWWLENIKPLADQTSMAHEFDRWSKQWLHNRPLLKKFMTGIKNLTGKEALTSSDNIDEMMYDAEERLQNLPDQDAIKDSLLTVKESSKIASTFWSKYEFSVNSVLYQQIQKLATKIINDKDFEGNKFEKFVQKLSAERLLTTSDGNTVGAVLQSDPRAREAFKKYWTMMMPENLGTTHIGAAGATVHYEAKYNPYADLSKGEKLYPYFQLTNFENKTQFTKTSRPQTETQKMINRFNFNNYSIKYLYKKNVVDNWKNSIYGGMTKSQIAYLIKDQLVPNNISLIGTRGDASTFILVDIPKKVQAISKDTDRFEKYLLENYNLYKKDNSISKKQLKFVKNFLNGIAVQSNMSESEKNYIKFAYDGDRNKHRADWIQRHEFLTDVLGKEYIFDSPENISKRIKIPFTPVFTSPTLPPRKKMYFDSNGATIEIVNIETNDTVVKNKLTKMLDGKNQYIGDGAVFTSQKVFSQDYPEHFGNNANAVRIKTIHYANDGKGNIEASKHDEKAMFFPAGIDADNHIARIKDSNNNVIAVFKKDLDGDINIYEPNNLEEGSHIDYLSSNDETKIRRGELKKNNVVHILDGRSVGIIQYSDDSVKQESTLTTQSSYFVFDKKNSDFLLNRFKTNDSSPSSSVRMIKKLINSQKTGKDIDKLILSTASQYYDAIPGNVQELAKLGAGKYPSNLTYLREVVKNKILKKIADNKTKGSYLDFRPDFFNQVTQEETIVPASNVFIFDILKSMGKKNTDFISDADRLVSINDWLSKNNKYVLIIRSPLTSVTGLGLYKIKNLDPNIKASFIIHPKEVKERHEGDHDYDNAHVSILNDLEVRSWRNIVVKPSPLKLDQYEKSPERENNYELNQVSDVAANMVYGETAIGEIVNAMRYFSLFNKIFKDIEIPFVTSENNKTFTSRFVVKVRKDTDQIIDDRIVKKNGEIFKGTFSDYLKIHLQSALDHPQVMLLNKWEYTLEGIYRKMFYNPNDPQAKIPKIIYKTINAGIIKKIFKNTNYVDNMIDPVSGTLQFNQVFDYSEEYARFVSNRVGYLENSGYSKKTIEENVINSNELTYEEKSKFLNNYAGLDTENLNIPVGNEPVDLTEQITVIFDNILTSQNMSIEEFYNVPPEDSLIAHQKTVRLMIGENNSNMKEFFTEEEIAEMTPPNKQNRAKEYAQRLQDDLYDLTKNERASANLKQVSLESIITSKTWDYNEKYIKFAEIWSKAYRFRLKTNAMQKYATLMYLKGGVIKNKTGALATRQSMNIIPPTSTNYNTTMHPEIMKEYFKRYNEELNLLNLGKNESLIEFAKENKDSIQNLRERNCE